MSTENQKRRSDTDFEIEDEENNYIYTTGKI